MRAAAVIAALQAPCPWLLPLVGLPSGLGLGLVGAAALAPLALLGSTGQRRRAAVLLLLGGTAFAAGVVVLAARLPGFVQGAAAIAAGVGTFALWTAGIAVARPGSRRMAPALAVLLASALPLTVTARWAIDPPARPVTPAGLVAGWRGPEVERLTQYLAWTQAGDIDALWAAGSPLYRERACIQVPSGCPALPRLSLGVPVASRLACSVLLDRCTFTRTDRYDQPPVPGSGVRRVDWTVQTDLDGRFEGVDVTVDRPGFHRPLPSWPDAGTWLLVLGRTAVTAAVLAAGVYGALRAGPISTREHGPWRNR